MSEPGAVLRVANCSGFYGDRLSAAREMVEGGPIDVLTGDYLAELTLTILHKDLQADSGGGYAKTFPLQLKQIAATCLERQIKIVVNAGGLNPAGCAEACRHIYRQLGLAARVAHIEGDDLLPRLDQLQAEGETFEHLDQGLPLASLGRPISSANAYLGAWGIAKALELGADLVICPRVTDASLVVGPAAWRFGWDPDDWDRLASAAVAGHILECGAQATGGNYPFFRRLPGLAAESPSSAAVSIQPGFPLAEIRADGSFVITKHPGTGGRVSVGTVTAQLLYEIASPRYANPDVTARFDTLRLSDDGPDRVLGEGVIGEPPPDTIKVCLNYQGGFKNRVTFLLAGLDIEAKASLAEEALWASLGGKEQFAETRVRLRRPAASSADGVPPSLEESFSFLEISVKDPDPKKVGRRFTSAAVEMALASYPGFNLTAPPSKESSFAVYWPALVARHGVEQRVVFDGKSYPIPHAPIPANFVPSQDATSLPSPPPGRPLDLAQGPTALGYLGRIVGARSGDKGGNANLGIWIDPALGAAEDLDLAYTWLCELLSVERLRQLLPEARELEIERYELPNLRALNFVLKGFLGEGVAASLATDAQAKALGEHIRAQKIPIPLSLRELGNRARHSN